MATFETFDAATRRKLEGLMLVARRVRSGAIKGDRRSNKRGTSIEFADYRNYTPGDDLRRLDWNVYARLDRPLIKLFEDEEDLAVHLLLDASASMNFPQGEDANVDTHKFTYARRLIAALATVSLTTNDRLTIRALGGDNSTFGPVRGRANSPQMMLRVGAFIPDGTTDLNAALRQYAAQMRRTGLVVLVSDMFTPNGYIEGLNALIGKGCEVVILHLLAPEEVEPPLAGDLRLIDTETGIAQEVSLDETMRALYTRRVNEWREGIRAECAKRGAHYIAVQTDTPWEQVVLQQMRRTGVVK